MLRKFVLILGIILLPSLALAAFVPLPVNQGGTGWGYPGGLESGRIIFGSGTSRVGTSTNLFWDNTNSRLGVGSSTPGFRFSIGSGSTGFSFSDSGTSSIPYASTTALSAASLCLTGDTCRTTWPSSSGGGTGNVATSSQETATYVPFYTSTNGTPALISGGSANFTWNNTIGKLIFPYASSTAISLTNLFASNNAEVGSNSNNGQSVYLFSHFRTDAEKAFLLSSNDGIEWAKAASSTIFTAPSGTVRDPSIAKIGNVYYMAYTSGGFSPANDFGIASSTDLTKWEHLTQVDVSSISGSGNVWAPEWFVDTDGSVHILFASNKSGRYRIYETNPTNTHFTTWSAPTEVTGTNFGGMIDAFVVKKDGVYNLWYVATSTPAYIEYATSTSLTSGYNIAKSGDWASWGGNIEGESLVQVDSDTWRIYMDDYSGDDQEMYYSESSDNWSTWSTRKVIYAAGTSGFVRHGTVIKLNDFNSLRNVAMSTAQAFGSSNLFFDGDYVGIGTTTPKAGLHITGYNGLVVEGLGNNSPGVVRSIPGDGNSTGVLEAYRTNGQSNWGNPVDYERVVLGFNQYIGIGSNAHIGVENGGTGSLRDLLFTMGGVEMMRLRTAGFFGIGTSTPGTPLSVTGSGVFTGRVTAPSYNATSTTVSSIFPYASTTAVTIGGSGSSFIISSGNGGWGTTSPGTKISIGDTGNSTINISETASSTFGTGINLRTGCFAIAGTCLNNIISVSSPLSLASGTLSLGNVKQYPAFTYSTSTAWTGTTTIPLGPAYVAETWNGVQCFTDTGTVGVSFYDGTNRMNYIPTASTTVNINLLTTNNSFTASEKRYVDIGNPASTPTSISCTVSKTMSIN